MKLAAKIFTIIGMIAGFWMILPLVFGIMALKKLKTATTKKEAQTAAILNLIFCNMLGGIFMLCLPESAYAENAVAAE